MSQMPPKFLFRIHEVCEVLGLSRSKVYQLISAGDLPVVRVGKSVRVTAEDLSLWVTKLTELQPE